MRKICRKSVEVGGSEVTRSGANAEFQSPELSTPEGSGPEGGQGNPLAGIHRQKNGEKEKRWPIMPRSPDMLKGHVLDDIRSTQL